MWVVNGNSLQMAEGDYGIALPIQINGVTLTEADTIRVEIKAEKNGDALLVKDLTPSENEVRLMLTSSESATFPPGDYVYSLDWYQNGSFMCNIVTVASFKVVDKA